MTIRGELNRMLRSKPKQVSFEPPPPPPDPWDEMAWWEKGLDVLSRPNYASAAFAKSILTGQGNPFKEALKGFTGEKRTTYSDVLASAGMDKGLLRATIGFAGDVLLDPTTYLTAGAGAGAKITVGGVAKVLTKGGQAAHTTMAAAKAARLAELVPKLAQTNPAALERLLRVTGLTGIGKDLTPDLLAKVAGSRVATQSIGKVIEGKAVPAGMEALLGKGAKASDVVKPSQLRFMGAPIPGSAPVLQGIKAGAKGAYALAEKVPLVGKVFTGARVVAEKTKAAAKAVFSTSSGLPEFDRLVRQYADILDYKTMKVVNEYKTKIIQPMKALRAKDPRAYEAAMKEINVFLEGVVEKSVVNVPDEVKIAEATGKLNELTAKLVDMDAGIKRFEMGALQELTERSANRATEAAAAAKAENAASRAAYQQGPGELLKEIQSRGISRGGALSAAEFSANIPKALRKKAGQSVDQWIAELTRRGLLPPGANENDLYKLLVDLKRKPAKVAPADILANTPEPTLKRLPIETATKRAGLEAEIAAAKKGVEAIPPVKKTVAKVVAGKLPSHPAAAFAAQFIKQRFEDIWKAEQTGLALPPNKLEHYLPHYMRDEVRGAIIEVINSDARKIMRPEFLGSLTEATRRSTTGKVDEITLAHLIDSGHLDPSKVKAIMEARGVKMTGDDFLVFENDPIKIALNRELRSIRSLNAADMARDIMESPVFLKSKVKLGDTVSIRETLAQHPEHALFVPTKAFLENFRTAAEREALYLGKEKQLTGSFLQEIERVLLDDIAKSPVRAQIDAYILPREVAEHLAKAYSMQFDDKAIAEFFRTWDKMTGWWKTFATAPNPGFHVRNEISNLWQLMLGGVRTPDPLYKGLMVLAKKGEGVADVGAYKGQEVYQLAERYGILRTGFVGSDIGDLVRREVAPSANPFSVAGPLARWGSAVGTSFEDHARLALFIDQLAKGADPAAASMHVKKYLFDYRDLTKAEKGIFRRMIPFYTFTRKSIPLAIETALTKPGTMAALGKMQTAGEKNVEDPIPSKYVADWIKEGLGVPIRTSGGKTEFFLLKGWIPMAELTSIDVQQAFGMLHPAIKAPIEIAMNQNVFTGRQIEKFPGQKDKLLGVPMRAKASHLLRNIVFLQHVDRLFFQQALDPVGTPAAVLGFRTYAQDKVIQMRTRVYDLNGQIGDLKNIISMATKKYGAGSGITRQAEERLLVVHAERDRVKADLLVIDPTALTTKKPSATPKPKPLPTTMRGFRQSVDIKRLLSAPQPTQKRALGP